jgi:TM2 domain-containing membrane protein YozV
MGSSGKRITAGLLAIFFGGLGVHKFYLGYTQAGVIQLIIGVCTWGVSHTLGIVEGIIYLTMSDDQFDRTYVYGKKEWL